MKAAIRNSLLIFLLSVFFHPSFSQDALEQEEIEKYKGEVRQMVSFFEYMLNTLGDKKTSARDKDVIITQSYEKIFRDDKVQIEDDLDENRDVITNKDVSAYLKDVNFFFKNVDFTFEIEDITSELNQSGNYFFKVKMLRNLKGLTVEGDSINSTIPRYLEVNYNPENQDLKIVSVYTNEFNESKALLSWWDDLSFEWKYIFRQKYNFEHDSLSVAQIKTITAADSLNLADLDYVKSIDPLSKLTDLVFLDLSGTGINDITPLRNLTRLRTLNLSKTEIRSIDNLRYSRALESVDISFSKTSDIQVLSNMPRLKYLNAKNSEIFDLSSLSENDRIEFLDISHTKVTELSPLTIANNLQELIAGNTEVYSLFPLTGNKNLTKLMLDSTNVVDLSPLSDLKNLKILSLNNTSISSLKPLSGLENLTNLYIDNASLILPTDVKNFAKNHPKTLIIYDSEDTQSWWLSLNDSWRSIFTEKLNLSSKPGKEELAKIPTIDSISLKGNPDINDLEPLKKLSDLVWLNASNTGINNLEAIGGLDRLNFLSIENTNVSSVNALKNLAVLATVVANETSIKDLEPLHYHKGLKSIYLDKSSVSEIQVNQLLDKNPDVLIIYQTEKLTDWWDNLISGWKTYFENKIGSEPSKEDLHEVTQKERIEFSGNSISSLKPLEVFSRLKTIKFNGTAVSDLMPLIDHDLVELTASNSPISNLGPLGALENLKVLNISNTPVESLEALENLKNLKEIDCSGTQIKRLNDLELIHGLEVLNCSNTDVRRLDPVQYLSLKQLICYNTRINDRRIEDFKEDNPNCEVTYY